MTVWRNIMGGPKARRHFATGDLMNPVSLQRVAEAIDLETVKRQGAHHYIVTGYADSQAFARAAINEVIAIINEGALAAGSRRAETTGSVRSKPERPAGQRPNTVTPSSQDTDQ